MTSGFESRGRVRKVNRPGRRARPLSGCAGDSVAFESLAFRSWRMNQPGGWPRPETGRRVTPWASCAPSSAISGLFTPGRRAALESEPARERAPFRRRIGVRALGIVSSALRSGRCAAGAAAGPEPSRRESPCGDRHLHLPLNGRDPAGRRGRSDKAVLLGSTPRRPTQPPASPVGKVVEAVL